jgi:hypothetical protein
MSTARDRGLGWEVLPQGIRGQHILQWGADHAWLASPANPERGVRRWCRRWARLSDDALAEIVASTKTSKSPCATAKQDR